MPFDPFLGEISITAANFEPRGWAFCNGQLMSIAQNSALFSLLGTTYGGNGVNTFGLPDLRGRVPLHFGQGPGLRQYTQGDMGGEESVYLMPQNLPSHFHGVPSAVGQTSDRPNGQAPAVGGVYGPPNAPGNMASTLSAGGDLPHNNMQPYLTLNFIIALQGVFPTRS